MRTVLHAVLVTSILLAFPAAIPADELELINRPVNSQGLTGLLFTASPFTLPRGIFEIGLSTVNERSFLPDYSVTGHTMTVSYGVGTNVEAAVRGSFWSREEEGLVSARGAGDAELALKWCVLPPREYSSRPSIAVLVKGIGPTGDRDEATNGIINWGAGAGLSVGGELFIEDYVMGYYADGMVMVQDLSDIRKRDRYHTANAGVLLPISKHRNLQMFLEYNLMHDRDRVSLYDTDHTGVTYGLRVVNARFNLTFGTQFRHRNQEGYDNASRIIGLLSVKI